MKKIFRACLLFAAVLSMSLAACSPQSSKPDPEVTIFIAASLENAFKEIMDNYNKQAPDVRIRCNADSSGTLMTQIKEGAACDLFFSAAVSQMDTLEKGGLIVEGSRVDLLANELVLITTKDSGTAVKGLANIEDAGSFALAGGSVPAGKYTRQALIALGKLDPADDPASIKTAVIQDKLGVEINECSNVSKVKEAVKEGACEVGTVYYTDAYSVIDDVDILEHIRTDLTGEIIYPVALVINSSASEEETAAAKAFYDYLQTSEALAVFEKYLYTINTP